FDAYPPHLIPTLSLHDALPISPKDGAMGLFWEGDTLYVTGDGGLRRFKTKDGDHAAGPSELIRKLKTGSEHMAHAIARGPDGWRSEEHTSELQSRFDLVCRLLL